MKIAKIIQMSYRLLWVWVLVLALAPAAWAQLSTTSKKAEKLYEESKEHLRARDFDRTIKALNNAIEADPKFVEAHFALAQAYSTLLQKDKAEVHFRRAAELSPDDKRLAPLYLQVAQFELQAGQFALAKANLEKFVKYANPSAQRQVDAAKRQLADCNFAIEGLKNPLSINPQPVSKSINRQALQFFPVLTGDQQQMLFTARLTPDKNSDENIYLSTKVNGEWGEPTYIKELNTHTNEGTCTMSADGKTLIFTVCQESDSRQTFGSCDLFVSYKVGGVWQAPSNLGREVNSDRWDTQPSLSADGRTLYFVSDRAGSVGGTDIWRTRRNEKGQWQPAENLGREVNTPRSELGPFIHVNGKTLYFASDGYVGMGGYDLFKTERENGRWATPENLGYPLNDQRNQVGLFVTADSKRGYYSHEQSKNGMPFSSEIYEFELPDAIKPKVASTYVKGIVYDAATKRKLAAKIDLVNLANDTTEATVSSDAVDGGYLITLNRGSEYGLFVNCAGYLFKSLSFNYSGTEGGDVVIDIPLERVGKGSKIVLNNIFFETGKWDLQEKSQSELNRLLGLMKQNPDIKVEIGGHTDDVGSDAANLELSRKRAQAVVEYLTKAGVPAARLLSKGYGETKPQAPNDGDANRALNRRIEFVVQ
jgi:OmpA-OmpF porin, OOP family